jgi:hypothetical protein
MKINLKALIAIALIAVAAIWAFTSLQSQSYAGTSLDFKIGRGPVTVTNSGDAAVSVHLAGTGSRSFTVSSATEGIAGTSVREGSGRTATQLLDFVLPEGATTFTVANGTDVQLTAESDARLSATVQPSSASETQSTLIAASVVILASLFYLSRTTEHRWIKSVLRRGQPAPVVAVAVADLGGHSQGQAIRSYGDNRT